MLIRTTTAGRRTVGNAKQRRRAAPGGQTPSLPADMTAGDGSGLVSLAREDLASTHLDGASHMNVISMENPPQTSVISQGMTNPPAVVPRPFPSTSDLVPPARSIIAIPHRDCPRPLPSLSSRSTVPDCCAVLRPRPMSSCRQKAITISIRPGRTTVYWIRFDDTAGKVLSGGHDVSALRRRPRPNEEDAVGDEMESEVGAEPKPQRGQRQCSSKKREARRLNAAHRRHLLSGRQAEYVEGFAGEVCRLCGGRRGAAQQAQQTTRRRRGRSVRSAARGSDDGCRPALADWRKCFFLSKNRFRSKRGGAAMRPGRGRRQGPRRV